MKEIVAHPRNQLLCFLKKALDTLLLHRNRLRMLATTVMKSHLSWLGIRFITGF
jgi:hypothetical protein